MTTSHGLPPGTPSSTAATDSSRGVRNTIEWLIVIAVAVVLALLVRSYVAQTFFIPSTSMEPTLEVGDRILVLKAAYDFTSPAVGDVIVFRAPALEHEKCSEPQVQDLVKRIIALPGQSIFSKGNDIYIQTTVTRNDHAVVHNSLLAQPWQHTKQIGQAIATAAHPERVPANSYFVMGDNRPNSCDSRVWGFVPRANIVGKAIFIFWPLSRISTI